MTRRSDQRGFAAAEWTAALGLFLIPVFFLVAVASRVPESKAAAQTIATEAARAAVQVDTCQGARDAASKVADPLAKQLHVSPDAIKVSFPDGGWVAGGTVKVTVTVGVSFGNTPLLSSANNLVSVSATHTEPIDRYRFITEDEGCAG